MKISEDLLMYDAQGVPHVTLMEAARRRGVSHQAIQKAIKAKKIKARQLGGGIAIPVSELEAYKPNRAMAKRAKEAVQG